MPVIDIKQYESVADITQALIEVSHHRETAFLLVDGHLFMVVPAEAAKDQVAEKIANRLAENPSLLSDLRHRLETEEPEDWK